MCSRHGSHLSYWLAVAASNVVGGRLSVTFLRVLPLAEALNLESHISMLLVKRTLCDVGSASSSSHDAVEPRSWRFLFR